MNIEKEKGNKHVKIAVKYLGFHETYNHTYVPETSVLQVKKEAMASFNIQADLNTYCMQLGDVILNDSLTLDAAGIPTGEQRSTIDLVAKERQDNDGGNYA